MTQHLGEEYTNFDIEKVKFPSPWVHIIVEHSLRPLYIMLFFNLSYVFLTMHIVFVLYIVNK